VLGSTHRFSATVLLSAEVEEAESIADEIRGAMPSYSPSRGGRAGVTTSALLFGPFACSAVAGGS
jgi:hypothetical protein